MFTYSAPGGLDDLAGRPSRTAFLNDWHKFILDNFRDNIASLGVNPLFFSEAVTPATSGPVPIPWNAFPLSISRALGGGHAAWVAADQLRSANAAAQGAPPVNIQYRPQDEYCEWFAYIDAATHKISRVAFTAEGPEYWINLANADFDRVVALYQQLVDASVQPQDLKLASDLNYQGTLLPAGTYNPFNAWNTVKGVIHLTHPANTLGAEINLAARGSQTLHDNAGSRVTDVRRLICCAGYGNANRSSDPTIGWTVNTTCLPIAVGAVAMDATLADPVALYMNNLQSGAITGPSGEPLDSWFRFVRGTAGKGLMAVLEPPPGAAFGLDQVSVKGVPLQFGGQIAELINMVLYAKVKPHAGNSPALASCSNHCCMPAGTPPGKLPTINLSQATSGASCPGQQVEAYPELASPLGHVLAEVALATTAAVPKWVWRTRRAGE